ncbi:hypothetical protein [Desulfovibrio gilichinskyi]|uniref:Uncharacterized protein n=1 Tax=Desulfovibrio gilichinskyi TaxID=1519643 RepID=A0A1X7C107_9BACT|nr:hypothetical protein [Desulfovibrio gilichinskyi]SME87866.1 hypothetical protein SAMN06295933_0065 [Desulfovibrio gilichinskyi]
MFTTLQKSTGWLILTTLILFLASGFTPSFVIGVAIMAWLVVIIEWNRLPATSRKQACFLLVVGIAALLFSAQNGIFLGWQKIMTQNLQLLPMFIAVSFLALANPAAKDDNLPTGKRAMVITAFGTNLLGAVINLSILFVFGDRLERNNTLTKAQAILLARSFCAASWWSPFFIAAGVALTYAPEMQYHRILLPGLILCVISICYSIVEVGFIRKSEFTGYPVRVESMTVPLILAVAVIAGHYFFPELGMIMLICIVAPPAAILLMRGRPRLPYLHEFITYRINSTVSQFVLFITAGVFSVGITSVIQVYPELFNFAGNTFSHGMFAIISALLIVLGLIGVHPLVGISIVSPLLLPLHPDNSRLAFLFLTSWSISTGSSPLSGVGLVLTSRYHISPRSILTSNFHYVVAMWLISNAANILYFG